MVDRWCLVSTALNFGFLETNILTQKASSFHPLNQKAKVEGAVSKHLPQKLADF
jgi:hypothetical protein